jgi:DNA polymerase-3 subunit alpha
VKIGPTFDLNVAEWPRSELLAREREMLGLYVSSHPLEGAERILERNRDTSIVGLLENGRSEGVVRIAGVIAKVDRRVNKTSGSLWAIITIEDLDAAVEVLFFPKSYEIHGPALMPDAVVSVRGRLSERDGAISIFGQDLTPLDVSSATADTEPPVVLTMPTHKVTPDLVGDLKRILTTHPGNTPVHLHIHSPQRTSVLRLGPEVDTTGAFWGDIKSLLGTKAVVS